MMSWLYYVSFETYTFMMTSRSPQSFADSYTKSVIFIQYAV